MRKFRSFIGVFLSLSLFLIGFSGNVFAEDDPYGYHMGSAVNTGKDNGFSGSDEIVNDDPHYGWDLGKFYINGYTQHTTDPVDGADVFLKNVGDEVSLDFILEQPLESPNGNENLEVYADTNGFDQYFGTERFNDCRGLLIIRKTDYNNVPQEPIVYTDYLEGVEVGALTNVQLFEEGDYEVALDYELRETNINLGPVQTLPSYTNYRIFFKFKIRNGNCMVYPRDVATQSELMNESFTEAGFYLDLANSRYLTINIQRYVLYDGSDTLSVDTRFNQPAADGEEFREQGIYVINVTNIYTGETTTKTIYVGTNQLLIAYVTTGQDIATLREMFANGAILNEDGSITLPTPTPMPEETLINNDDTVQTQSDADSENGTVSSEVSITETSEGESIVLRAKSFITSHNRMIISLSSVLVIAVVLLIVVRTRGKRVNR